MPVSFPEAEDMTQVRRNGAASSGPRGSGDASSARGSARDSWSRLKAHLNDGGPQLDPDTEDRVSRASARMSCGVNYRDSMRMSGRPSFVQLVSDLQEGSKPEGEAMKYITRRRSRMQMQAASANVQGEARAHAGPATKT